MRTASTIVAICNASLVMAAGLVGPATAVPPDWSKIATKTIKLFYPGQSTYDWLLSREHERRAARKIIKGEACVSCHKGEEDKMGIIRCFGFTQSKKSNGQYGRT